MAPFKKSSSSGSSNMPFRSPGNRKSGFVFSFAICALAVFSLGCSNSESGSSANGNSPKSDAGAAAGQAAGSTEKINTRSKSASFTKSKDADAKPKDASKPKKIVVSTEPDINEPEFHEALIAATEDYLRFGMVNSVALPAPVDCGPPDSDAPKPLMSESEHEASHGQKLYFLFAKEIGHYVNPEGKPSPVGQVVVKESWTTSPSKPSARNMVNHASGNRINPRTKVGDQMLQIGQRQNFFVMTKLAKDTPKTDQGWVYGVVDADSREVVASGKVASCMSCHVEAPNDRLFGTKLISFEETIVEPKDSSSKKLGPEKGSTEK